MRVSLYRRGFFLFLIFSLTTGFTLPGYAEDAGPTARGIFALLPDSIFENTPEGLSEESKQELLQTGSSEFWEIIGESPDLLVLAERPFQDRAIALRLFRNVKDGSTEIAIGTLGEPVCTLELWRMDITGRIIPIDTPPEPSVKEFFHSRKRARNGETVLICLGEGGLQAHPVLWDKKGYAPMKVDKDIFYTWDGSLFRKQVRPHTIQTQHPGTSSLQIRE